MRTKKMLSKVFALLLAVATILSMSVSAFADTITGSITVENPTIGNEYAAYKVFDLTYLGTGGDQKVAYTYTKREGTDAFLSALQGDASPFTLEMTTTANVYNVKIKSGKTVTDISTFLTEQKGAGNLGTAVKTVTPTAGSQTVKFSNLDLGYYYITSEVGTVVTIDSTTKDVTVKDKNPKTPTPVDNQLKKVTDGSGTTVSYSIGDTIPFEVNLNTVNWVTTDNSGDVTTEKVYRYVLTDTPTNVKIDSDSVKVYVGGDIKEKDKDYTLNYNTETGGLTVTVPWTSDKTADGTSLYKDGVVLKITYEAELTAIDDNGEAKNNAVMKYNDKNASTGTVTVETGKISVLKYDTTDASKEALSGAEFDLYKTENGGTKINLVENEDGTYQVATSEQVNTSGFTSKKIKAGEATIKGLAAGTYYLEETKAPDGYNRLTSRVQVIIGENNVGEDSTAVEVEVPNSAGSALPSTGGIGTTIFYVIGGILVAGAAVLLIVKKRMSDYQE